MSNSASRECGTKPQYVHSVKKAFGARRLDQVLTIAPSILASDFANLATELKRMMRARCYWAHLDVMDGHFVPNITFGPPVVASIRNVSPRLFLDAHLMIERPFKYVERFVKAGAQLITIHAETVKNLPAALDAVRREGVQVGLCIKPATPVQEVEHVLEKLDLLLVMSVEPGFGGQALMPGTLNKVRQLARIRSEKNLRFLIQIDGGINVDTAGLAVAAGANILVAGTAVFGGRQTAQNIQHLADAALRMGG